MSRLIDADVVMRMLTSVELNNGTITDAKMELRNVKTAYDVEKVVERLEKERICLEDNYGDEVICIGAHDAIDIVKRGWVE